jgi:hypothetical protein
VQGQTRRGPTSDDVKSDIDCHRYFTDKCSLNKSTTSDPLRRLNIPWLKLLSKLFPCVTLEVLGQLSVRLQPNKYELT